MAEIGNPLLASQRWQAAASDFLGRSPSESELEAFAAYERLLLEWNQKFNLTSIIDPQEIRIKHFLDSLSALPLLGDLDGLQLADVGTGAGFPGIVLKIIFPQMRLTLIDSVAKKLKFCDAVIQTLGLKDCETIHERAELLAKLPARRESFDIVAARAVARLPILSEYLLPLLKVGGRMVAYKGETGAEEARDAAAAIRKLGGAAAQVHPVTLPTLSDRRYLLLVQKREPAPAEFPRASAQIKAHPLA